MSNMLIACTAFVFVFVCPLDLQCILHSEFVIIFIAYVYTIYRVPLPIPYIADVCSHYVLSAFCSKLSSNIVYRVVRAVSFSFSMSAPTDIHMFLIRKIPKTEVNNRILERERERERDDKQSCLFASRLRAHTIQCQTCSAYIHIYYMRGIIVPQDSTIFVFLGFLFCFRVFASESIAN